MLLSPGWGCSQRHYPQQHRVAPLWKEVYRRGFSQVSVLRKTELLQNEFITLHTMILRAELLGYSKPDFRASLASRQAFGRTARGQSYHWLGYFVTPPPLRFSFSRIPLAFCCTHFSCMYSYKRLSLLRMGHDINM